MLQRVFRPSRLGARRGGAARHRREPRGWSSRSASAFSRIPLSVGTEEKAELERSTGVEKVWLFADSFDSGYNAYPDKPLSLATMPSESRSPKSERDVIRRATELIVDRLPEAWTTDLQEQVRIGRRRADAVLTLQAPDSIRAQIIIEAKQALETRDALSVASQLEAFAPKPAIVATRQLRASSRRRTSIPQRESGSANSASATRTPPATSVCRSTDLRCSFVTWARTRIRGGGRVDRAVPSREGRLLACSGRSPTSRPRSRFPRSCGSAARRPG